MRSTWQRGRDRAEVELAMTPMIDVVFLLLVFFLATASFEKIEQSMPAGLGEIATQAAQQSGSIDDWVKEISQTQEDIVVRIEQADADAKPQYLLNGQPVETAQEIAIRIAAIVKTRAEQPIIIDPDDDVIMDIAMNMYDLAKGAGAIEVFFATAPAKVTN